MKNKLKIKSKLAVLLIALVSLYGAAVAGPGVAIADEYENLNENTEEVENAEQEMGEVLDPNEMEDISVQLNEIADELLQIENENENSPDDPDNLLNRLNGLLERLIAISQRLGITS